MAMSGGTSKLVKTTNPFTDSSKEVKLYVYYKTSQNVASNTSTITCGMYVVTPSGWDIGAWTDYTGSYVGASDKTFDGSIPNFSGTMWLVENKQFTVNHKSNGTGTATIHWKWGVRSSWGGYYEPSGSFTITLPTIPRASSIKSALNVTLGNKCNITWTPASSSFRYKLKFVLGSWDYETEAIHPNSTSEYIYDDYIIPLDAANELPNDVTGSMVVYLYTYSDSECSVQIGSTSNKKFTVTVPNDVIPTLNTITATIINDNPVIEDWGVAVVGYTKIKLESTASGSYGSTISSFELSGDYNTIQNGTSLEYIGGVIGSPGEKMFTVVAKDSRGRSSSPKVTTPITFCDYYAPQISYFKVSRIQQDASQVQAKVDWSFSSIEGNNSTKGYLYYKKSSETQWIYYGEIDKKVNSLLFETSFDENTSYNFKIVVKDSLSDPAQEEGFISTIKVTMDFRAGGKGIGIGKIAESDNLEIAFDTIFMGNVYIQSEDGTKTLLSDYIRSLIT